METTIMAYTGFDIGLYGYYHKGLYWDYGVYIAVI